MSKRTKESQSKSAESEEDSKHTEESDESSEDEEDEKLTQSKKIAAAEARKKKRAAAKPKPRKRKANDENAPPKKPTTAYAFYMKDKRPEFQAKFNDLKFGDLSKKIAAAWRALDDEQKKPYTEKYLEDKKRYQTQLEHYNATKKPSTESEESSEDSSPKKRKKKKKKTVKKKIEGQPKQATNAYMFFQSANREQIKKDNPTLKTLPLMAKKMGEIWKGMNEEEKKPYAELAAKDKIRYENEKKIFKDKQDTEKKEKEAKEAKEKEEEEDDDDDDDSGEES